MSASHQPPLADQKLRANRELDHLPGDYGIPVVGKTIEAVRHTDTFAHDMYERYGPVFRTETFFERRVVLVGPEAGEMVLMDREKNFSSLLGWDRLLGRFFPKGLMLRDFEDHRHHRLIMQEAFKKAAMESYLEVINEHTARVIASWPHTRPMLFYDAVKQLTLDIAVMVFLGLELDEQAKRVNRALIHALGGVIALVPVPVPGLATWKGLRGREMLYDYLSSLVPEKRRSESSDMFSRLCHARSEDGAELSDDDVVNHMIFMLLAAHDTTTSSLATIAYTLAKHPEWQERLREESGSLGTETLSYAELAKLESIDWVFKEALRLYPPVVTTARRNLREFEFAGHRIPPNTAINFDVRLTHYMPEWWTDPEVFDPERFSPERAEHKRHRFSWVPFGGGAHMCLGMHFAYMLVKAILHPLLAEYRLTVAEGYEMPYRQLPIPKPADRLPLTLKPLKKQ